MADKKIIHFKNQFLIYEGKNTIKCKSNGEVQKGAILDPDALPQTKKQLSKFKRVNPFIGKLHQ